MSFLIKKEIKINMVDDSSGVIYGTSNQLIDVVVTVTAVTVNADKSAIVFFQYGDDPGATSYATFNYEGGDYFEEGEVAAKKALGAE
ncbi:MAG: hypothetical protein WAU54_01615 [Chania sp.]